MTELEATAQKIGNLSLENKSNSTQDEWAVFELPDHLPTAHPYLSRYYNSAILEDSYGPAGKSSISTTATEVYGNNIHPILFRIGNGGAGYTRIFKALCLKFIRSHGDDFRIAWVANHSRHTQIALLGDVVQVALTYEPRIEKLAVEEGWCKIVQSPAFWDHFILVGPRENPAQLRECYTFPYAFWSIRATKALFHTRGDGSATWEKEQELREYSKVDAEDVRIEMHALSPYQALEKAALDGAYLITDRATFLTCKADGKIPDLVVYVEEDERLLNPCSALTNTKVPDSPAQRAAMAFAEWLGGETAQSIFWGYGRVWELGMPLFTPADRAEFSEEDLLVRKVL